MCQRGPLSIQQHKKYPNILIRSTVMRKKHKQHIDFDPTYSSLLVNKINLLLSIII